VSSPGRPQGGHHPAARRGAARLVGLPSRQTSPEERVACLAIGPSRECVMLPGAGYSPHEFVVRASARLARKRPEGRGTNREPLSVSGGGPPPVRSARVLGNSGSFGPLWGRSRRYARTTRRQFCPTLGDFWHTLGGGGAAESGPPSLGVPQLPTRARRRVRLPSPTSGVRRRLGAPGSGPDTCRWSTAPSPGARLGASELRRSVLYQPRATPWGTAPTIHPALKGRTTGDAPSTPFQGCTRGRRQSPGRCPGLI